MTRALGVQRREIWQVTTGSLSDQLEPTRPMHTPKTLFLDVLPLSAAVFKYHSSSRQRLGSHGTTAALQAFHLLCDSHERCFSACGFVSVRECARVIVESYSSSTNQEQSQEQSQQRRCHSAFITALFFILLCCLLLLMCVCITP